MQRSRAYRIHGYGGPDVLRLPDEIAGKHDVQFIIRSRLLVPEVDRS